MTKIAVVLVGVWLSVGAANAESYPSRAITLIVPFPPGGPTDSVARIVADRMQVSLGQPMIIENVTGASGSLGVGRAARAVADGYTLSFGTWSTHVINGAIFPLQFDLLRDFEPISLVSDNPLVLISNKNVPARDLQELIAWLKANPGKASSGTAGLATPPSLAAILFQHATETRFQLVHYNRGSGLRMQDLLANRLDLGFEFVAEALPQVRAGSVRAYAVLNDTRLPSLPDVPTVDEAGLSGLYVSSWQAMWAPKGTPASVIRKLNNAVTEALDDPAVSERLHALAQRTFPPNELTPEVLGKLQKGAIEKWWPVVKAANIKPE